MLSALIQLNFLLKGLKLPEVFTVIFIELEFPVIVIGEGGLVIFYVLLFV